MFRSNVPYSAESSINDQWWRQQYESEKEEAFRVCLPLLEQISNNSSINSDFPKFVKRLLVALSIDEKSKENLAEMFDTVLDEISNLKHSIQLQSTEIKSLEEKINWFESNMSLNDLKIDAYE